MNVNPAIIKYVLVYLSIATLILVAMTSLMLKNRDYDTGSKWFKSYFLIAAIIDVTLYILSQFKTNTMPVINLFCVAQFFLISMAMISWINKPELRRKLFFLSALISLVFTIYVLGTLHRMEFEVVTSSIENLLLMLLAAMILMQLTTDTNDFLIRNHKFWFTVSVFIYFSVSTIIYATANMMLYENVYINMYTWNINAVMSIMANLMYLKGILCLPAKKMLYSQYS